MGNTLNTPLARGRKLALQPPASAPVIDLAAPASPDPGLNIFRPIPPNGRSCAYSGLGHSRLYRLLVNPGPARKFVRVCSLKQPGQSRATQLYHVGDLLAYLTHLAEEQRLTEDAA